MKSKPGRPRKEVNWERLAHWFQVLAEMVPGFAEMYWLTDIAEECNASVAFIAERLSGIETLTVAVSPKGYQGRVYLNVAYWEKRMKEMRNASKG